MKNTPVWQGAAFLASAAAIYVAILLLSRARSALAHPGVFGLAALCDLTITVPVLYYLLLVRTGNLPRMGIVAVSLAGARAAGFLLPGAEQVWLPPVRWAALPLELWAVIRILRLLRRSRSGADTSQRIREIAGALFRNRWAAEFITGEILVFYYALFAWRAKPESKDGSAAFTVTEASGYGMFSVLVTIILAFEGVPMHFVLRRWSPPAAWISTALGLYGLLWIVALRRSVSLRPMFVSAESILLQIGFLWRIEFPREQIACVRRIAAGTAPDRNEPGYLRLAVINEPHWLIELNEPAIAHGLFFRKKSITRIGVAVDDSDRFGAALQR